MPKVNSSAIDRVRSLGKEGFIVKFRDGGVYKVNAPTEVYRQLRNADSVGGFYNLNIRNTYTAERLA